MTTSEQRSNQPSPELFFETITAYQKAEALKTGIELDLFTAIADGKKTISEIAARTGGAERGIRILCDYLTILGFLTKSEGQYELTQDSAIFLNKHSPAYIGSAFEFLMSSMIREAFGALTDAVKKGGTVTGNNEGSLTPEHPVWVKFARAMAPLMMPFADAMSRIIDPEPNRKLKILDIAAGHGVFGITFAVRNPQAEVVAQDWPNVLEVARENATGAGVIERYSTLPGNAFEVDFGTGYDVALITNFLHHFDPPTCESLLRKVHSSLAPGGRAVTLEFVPNEDRISPANAAGFSIVMLASTPAGDAYTFSELDRILTKAGFSRNELHVIPPGMQSLIVSHA